MAAAQPGPRSRRPGQDRDAAPRGVGRGLAHATGARRAAGPGRAGRPHRAAQPAAGQPPVGLPPPGVRGTGHRDQLQPRPEPGPGSRGRQRGGPGSRLTGAVARRRASRWCLQPARPHAAVMRRQGYLGWTASPRLRSGAREAGGRAGRSLGASGSGGGRSGRSPGARATVTAMEIIAITAIAVPGEVRSATAPAVAAPTPCMASMPAECRPRACPLNSSGVSAIRRCCSNRLAEATASLIVLEKGTATHPGERPWAGAHLPAYRERLASDPVTALLVRAALGRRWIADCFTLAPTGEGEPVLSEELARVRQRSPEVTREDLTISMGGPLPARLHRSDLPERAADLLDWLWTQTVLPYWPRRRRIMEADVVARTRQLSQGGWAAALADMRPGM